MNSNPPIRKDGKCSCGKPRPAVAIKNQDPFCSTECCKKHYEVVPSVKDEPDYEAVPIMDDRQRKDAEVRSRLGIAA